ncbi:hypothetical protein CONLIGDRAFT_685795 [Coniochaeta ligniaria NRRL 30616]|uniref:Uncharacterized protein n=1 Tax=Coniochaeta ligniaria NRRL 30616 TaxID=1408157 RepID=A0A1J7J9G2_9PEZI|nr:hypothetical protein CONLIGDRAFT_685795 [Coniochaeta ligniaria NRRL 30616]
MPNTRSNIDGTEETITVAAIPAPDSTTTKRRRNTTAGSSSSRHHALAINSGHEMDSLVTTEVPVVTTGVQIPVSSPRHGVRRHREGCNQGSLNELLCGAPKVVLRATKRGANIAADVNIDLSDSTTQPLESYTFCHSGYRNTTNHGLFSTNTARMLAACRSTFGLAVKVRWEKVRAKATRLDAGLTPDRLLVLQRLGGIQRVLEVAGIPP